MVEDYYSRTPTRTSGISLRAVMGTTLFAFVGGAVLVGWLVWDDRIQLGDRPAAVQQVANSGFAAKPSPLPGPTSSKQAVQASGVEARIAELEAKLDRLDLQASAAAGNSARAEALMVAFATRRAIERGADLGFLGEQLKLRFGDAQPAAVATVLEAARQPVLLDQLASQLDSLAPRLADAPTSEGGWERFKRELSGLFVVRRDHAPSTRPEDRLERAKLLLRTGQVGVAIEEVARLPGGSEASAWITSARRYAETQRALEQLETAALLEPEKLKTSTGAALRQPSPAAAMPTPGAVQDGAD
jgi:hypothetical protein